jgi:TATA-box binding protein (TBP) (component of TFIID and TFIIIB)
MVRVFHFSPAVRCASLHNLLTTFRANKMTAVCDMSEGLELTNADEGLLEKYRKYRKPSPIIIKNCVATAFFGTPLDLEEISWYVSNYAYVRESFRPSKTSSIAKTVVLCH